MNRRSRQLAGGALTAGAMAVSLATLSAQVPTHSVWEGAYTADQAARGKALYDEKCSSCHLETLGGGDSAPPLAGSNFMANWDKQPVGDFVDRIENTMPGDAPGTLNRGQSTDITAYILQANQIPAGTAELPRDAQLQQGYMINGTRPDNVAPAGATPPAAAPANGADAAPAQ